ncbi:MAG: methylamine dehydrogenase accessory protein MauD [Halieaceae bacterium]|jgi:methylamine dehydrogenase accessory protein MauD
MDNLLIASNIILWILVLGLAVLVLALTRQIGVLYERVAPAGALMINKKLETGSVAPVVEVQDLNTSRPRTIGKSGNRAQLLFFMSPDCPVCKSLLPMIKSIQSAESTWLDVILASDGETQAHKDYIEQQDLSHMTYVSSEILGMQYSVSKLPYAVLIDEKGIIASLGLVNSREHFESLFESMERGIPSLQAFMAARSIPAAQRA